MFSYCTDIYKNCRDVEERVETTGRTERVLMTMGCFFGACWNDNSSHLFAQFQLDHHRGGILFPLSTGVLKDVEVLCLYDIFRLGRYDPMLCLLGLRRSQDIDSSRYGGDDALFFGYDLKAGKCLMFYRFLASRRSKTGSGVTVDFPGHEVR